MKLGLAVVMIILLTLGAIACNSSPDAQEGSGNNIESNSALSRVVLEVSTIT